MRRRFIGILTICLVAALAANRAEPQKAHSKKKSAATSSVRKKTVKQKGSTSKISKPLTVSDAKKREEDTQKEIKLTRRQIQENDAAVKKGLGELRKLESEISTTKKALDASASQISALNSNIAALEKAIAEGNAETERLRTEYLAAVKKMRVARNNTLLAFIFSSDDFHQAMQRMRYLRQFSEWRAKRSSELEAKTKSLLEQNRVLGQNRKKETELFHKKTREQTLLNNQYSRQDEIVAGLKKNGDALRSHLQKKQSEATMLKNRIAELIAEEQRKAAQEEARRAKEEKKRIAAEEKARRKVEEKEPTEKTTVTSGFAAMKGKLRLPVSGSFSVTSRFGRQSIPGMDGVVFENPGIDAETTQGASAVAVHEGKVSGVYMLPGYNTVVIVNHGGYYTVYGNLASTSVKNGDTVSQGDTLGILAPSESDESKGGIHFEVWKNRDKLNPLEWLR